jgi:hypothetical protein
MPSTLPAIAAGMIDKYFDCLTTPLQVWNDHLSNVRDVAKKLVNPPQTYSFRDLVADALELNLGCYDVAFWWMLPRSAGATDRTGSIPDNTAAVADTPQIQTPGVS